MAARDSRSAQTTVTNEFKRPVVAIVRNHLDTTYMGGLEVELLTTGAGNSTNAPGQLVPVKYLSPFYGLTSYDGMSKNADHTSSQRSYGFWGVPPDIGAKVLVIFAEGGDGYWIGCIPEENTNFMIPDQMASTTFNSQDKSKKLPVVEYNKKTEKGVGRDTTQYIKPANKDAIDVLTAQGLIEDEIRGVTSSSARRELPSAVFGISTPGPQDKRPGAPRVNYGENYAQTPVPQNRLGGSSLVFDDGDATLLRKKPAGEALPEYVNVEAGEKGGDPTLPHNELVRLRTRTGHQILLHNTEDLIYIGNAKGTTWIELTSNGKIDIFAEDSISIHTKQDLNLKADRDINFEAGRDFNVKANNNINFESIQNTTLYVGKDNIITTKGNLEVKSDGQNNFTAGKETNIKSGGNHIETAPKIHMNGPSAATAANTVPFNTFKVPGEENNVIMKRVPQHEPWIQHENFDPTLVTAEKTDVQITEDIVDSTPQPKVDTFKKSVKREAGAEPATKPTEATPATTTATKTSGVTKTKSTTKLPDAVSKAADAVKTSMNPASVASLKNAVADLGSKMSFGLSQTITGAIDAIASPSTLTAIQNVTGPAISAMKQGASDLMSLRTTVAKGKLPIASSVTPATTVPNTSETDRQAVAAVGSGKVPNGGGVSLSDGKKYKVVETKGVDEEGFSYVQRELVEVV
jgi:hypothetical protein